MNIYIMCMCGWVGVYLCVYMYICVGVGCVGGGGVCVHVCLTTSDILTQFILI